MQTFFKVLLNFLFFLIILSVAVFIGFTGFAKKEHDIQAKNSISIKGNVVKDSVRINAPVGGIVKSIFVKEAQRVHKGDVIVTMDNPDLKAKAATMEEQGDDQAAQEVQDQIKNLTVTAPIDGVVGNIAISSGASLVQQAPMLTVYSNQDIHLLANLDVKQYKKIRSLQNVPAYSDRLSRTFIVRPDVVLPEVKTPASQNGKTDQKMIQTLFVFNDNTAAENLLANEDLDIHVKDNTSHDAIWPVDTIASWWTYWWDRIFNGNEQPKLARPI